MYIQAVNRSVNALYRVCMFQVKLLLPGKLAFMHVWPLVHKLFKTISGGGLVVLLTVYHVLLSGDHALCGSCQQLVM